MIAAAIASPAFAQTLPIEKYPYVSGPITITSCSVNENTSNSTVSPNSLRINYYVNQRERKITSVTFRVVYSQTPVTITDTGTFDYKKQITHQFNQLGGAPWSGAAPTACRVLTATFADGQTVNPTFEGPDATVPGSAAPALPSPAPEVTPPRVTPSAPAPYVTPTS